MDQYFEYCKILGVSPGASAEDVKTAFRTRIKIHHPDRAKTGSEGDAARKLIEAYQAMKNGWPAHIPTTRPAPVSSPGAAANAMYERGRAAGQRIFDGAVRGRRESLFKSFFEEFARAAFVEDEEDPSYETPVRDHAEKADAWVYRPGQNSQRFDPADEYFDRAEIALREVVQKFSRKTNQSKRQWSREYVSHLLNVQVLFRDVMRRYPNVYGRANKRLRQIQELMQEIKAMAQ